MSSPGIGNLLNSGNREMDQSDAIRNIRHKKNRNRQIHEYAPIIQLLMDNKDITRLDEIEIE